ncbi:MAG: N-acetylglucosamine-6-phosphate deacetylase [Terriglobales bacterium]
MIELWTAARLLTPLETHATGAMTVEDGHILAVGPRAAMAVPGGAQLRDFGDAVLAPGLVDIHVHGGGGYDLMSADAGAVAAVRRHLARHGVTTFLATTMTAPWPATLASLERLGRAGVDLHLEGPFLSPRQRGVHPPADLLLPRPEHLEQLESAAQGRIRLITVAPELEGAEAFIAEASRRGICVSLGHSDADLAQARAGVRAGAHHVTHTFNAMRPLHHRDPGLLGEALANPDLSAEIIADGIHVHPALVAMFLRLKNPGRAVLVSDGISAAGRGDGSFALGGITVEVTAGRCMANGHLAGSVLTLDQAVRNVVAWQGLDLAAAVRLASLNPAQLVGLERKGRLARGADADVIVLSAAGEVHETYVAGRKVD